MTSFDMAGVSLTFTWLDDELEGFWRAPVDAPGYKKGTIPESPSGELADVENAIVRTIPDSSPEGRNAAALVLLALEATLRTIDENADELGRIDAVAGDGDHGIGMRRGATAAVAAARALVAAGAGVATVLDAAGDAWSDRAGGTSGALWGAILESLGKETTDLNTPSSINIAAGVRRATAAILEFGAVVGDKTMVDVLVPFNDAFSQGVADGASLFETWRAACAVADDAAAATADLLPRMGRARPHAEKSLGTPDAGATSLALIIREIGGALLDPSPQN
ncbi:dihydroxyacetone kinase [Mycetocola miduiensis]|uniref:Dihydroxyacetone kinase n=2 Tax=Mycetocola miduiensis TaxID=995034 RepID=A0A1I4ZIY5_9MICO|nr:dihydroxyacetone kinase [Mycetocola miduiensis]